jgi:hyperosmotically inducible protein
MRRGVQQETAMGRYLALPLLFVLMLSGCRTNESPEQQVNDLEITTSVKSKLASDVGLSTVPNISVNSTNGVVTLSGQVDTAEQKAKAESIARGTPHVVRVVDNLQLVTKP